MKSKYFFWILCIILIFPVKAQFMQNGGFEVFNNNFSGEAIDRANEWHNVFNSPDLLHNQVTSNNGSCRTGQGCAGFGLTGVYNAEFFYGTTFTLNANTKYVLTFYVKNGSITNTLPICAKITSSPPSPTYDCSDFATPQTAVSNYLNNPINQPEIIFKPIGIEYNKVTYCFTPQVSSNHYITFGIFPNQNSFNSNYFYLDDVNISQATIEQQNLSSQVSLVSTSLCVGNPIIVDGSNSQNETEFQWEIAKLVNGQPNVISVGQTQFGSASSIDINSVFSLIGHIPSPGDCYRVKLTVKNGCSDESIIDFCYEDPNVDFLNNSLSLCEGTSVDLTVTGQSDWLYTWSTGQSAMGLNSVSVIPSYPNSSYSVTITTPSQCTHVETIDFVVYSANNDAPEMNGINGTGEYVLYANQGDIITFSSQISNDNSNETFIASLLSSNIPTNFSQISLDNNNHQINFFWNTGQSFVPNSSTGTYQFVIKTDDNNQCTNSGVSYHTFQIIIICDQCPICVNYENRLTLNNPLPDQTKTGKCIEAGLTQPVETGSAEILFQAGQYINLGPFFSSGPGFTAQIDPSTCVTDCEECCLNWVGFTLDEIPNGVYMNFEDNIIENDIFQITDRNHPFCAFNAKGYYLRIYNSSNNTLYENEYSTNSCCPFVSPAPENPVSHSSIWWDGYTNNIFGNSVHPNDGVYFYLLKLFGCNSEVGIYQGFIHIMSSSGLINSPETISQAVQENYKNDIANIIIQDNSNEIELNLYPNPTNSSLEIIGIKIDDSIVVQLYDNNGILIENAVKVKNNRFNVTFLSSGEYYCKIIVGGKTITKKFIKL